jgi:hypothetical protein
MLKPLLILLAVTVFASARLHAQDATPSPSPATASPEAAAVETIVLIRHGEKPDDDKGQLTCRGLNRALALPRVLISKFGKADFIFAPLTVARESHGKTYSYVRPLMTIEPTAILLGLPVSTRFPEEDIDPLQEELSSPAYRNALVFVAWEHKDLEFLTRRLLAAFGDVSDKVPEWPANDYDSIYIVKIRSEAGARTASFAEDHEMLDGLSDELPTVTLPANVAH